MRPSCVLKRVFSSEFPFSNYTPVPPSNCSCPRSGCLRLGARMERAGSRRLSLSAHEVAAQSGKPPTARPNLVPSTRLRLRPFGVAQDIASSAYDSPCGSAPKRKHTHHIWEHLSLGASIKSAGSRRLSLPKPPTAQANQRWVYNPSPASTLRRRSGHRKLSLRLPLWLHKFAPKLRCSHHI